MICLGLLLASRGVLKGGLVLENDLRATPRVTVSVDSELNGALALVPAAAACSDVDLFRAFEIVGTVGRKVKFQRCLVHGSNIAKLVTTNIKLALPRLREVKRHDG